MSDDKAKKPRYGLIKAYVGSNHVMRHTDGKKRQHVVRDHAHYPSAKGGFHCFYCNQSWPSEEELKKAHPEQRVMVKQEEKHLFCFWSAEPVVTGEDEKGKPVHSKIPGDVVGFLSNEESPDLS